MTKSPRTRWILVVVLVVACVAVGGGLRAGGWRVFERPQQTAGCAKTPLPSDDNSGYFIDQYARLHFADSYAGTDQDGPRVLIYRVPSAAFDTWITTSPFAGACVKMIDVRHSEAELEALIHRIGGDVGYWRSVGVQINQWGELGIGNAVEVGTSDLARACRLFPSRYGRDAPIVLVEAGTTSFIAQLQAMTVRRFSAGGSPAASSPAPRPAFAAPAPAWPTCSTRSF
jgi:hypothetical protein